MERGERYSRKVDGKLSGRMAALGRNLRASALGMSSVWMKMVRREGVEGRSGCAEGDVVGRVRLWEEERGVVRGRSEKCLEVGVARGW